MEEKKYIYGTPENRAFLREQQRRLTAFGKQFPSPGGSSWYLGDNGTPMKDRSRETYITSRMAHVYTLASLLGDTDGPVLVDRALEGLLGELRDKKNGGWYAGLTASGAPLGDKLCYAHAFVILAACSGKLLGRPGAEELLDQALEDYDRYFWDEEEGMARDTWDMAFAVCDPYRGLNANMHSVEAFLAVADVTGREEYRARCGRIIDRVLKWAEGNSWRIPEHYTEKWEPDLMRNQDRPDDPFKPFGATPGHGIEWARLITQWACFGVRKEREYYISAARSLYERAVSDAWNADGAEGIAYTTDWEGRCVVHDRMHWTLAEAINTSAVLHTVTGDGRYAEDYASFLQYLDRKVIDHRNGSWFHQLDRNNHVIDTVWPGKPDIYHALQAMLIPYADPSLSIAVAVKQG